MSLRDLIILKRRKRIIEDDSLKIDKAEFVACSAMSVTVEEMRSKSRKREIVLARQVACRLMYKHTLLTLKQIGERLGGRDHTTVMYSIQTIQDLMDSDEDIRRTVEELELSFLEN